MPGSYRCARVVETSQFQHIQALVKNPPCSQNPLRSDFERKRLLMPIAQRNDIRCPA